MADVFSAVPSTSTSADPAAIVFRKDLGSTFGITLCRKRLLELEKLGKFPRSVAIGGQAAYRCSSVREWLDQKFSQPAPHRPVPQARPHKVRGKAGRHSATGAA